MATANRRHRRRIKMLSFVLLFVVTPPQIAGFSPSISAAKTCWPKDTLSLPRRGAARFHAKTDEEAGAETAMNPLTRASWYAVEAFGKVFGDKQSLTVEDSSSSFDLTKPPESVAETLERIRLDNDRSYFLSGDVDKLIYDPDCVFSDPFVSFAGRERFVENLANLGSFITKYSARMLDYATTNETTVKTRVMVKLQLNLPWKPILAWPWGVTYNIDPDTNLITDHKESWDIEPLEGVKQIFRKPTTTISE